MRHERLMQWLCAALLVVGLSGCGGSSSTSTGGAGSTAPSGNGGAASSAPAASVPSPPIVVGAGVPVVVTLNEPIGTKNQPGDHFTASLAAPVVVGNAVAIPVGARVNGVVTTAKEAGHIKGSATLAITLDSVRVGGQNYSLHTSVIERASKGRGERTAIGAGAGAAAGAIIGAIAGKGKGAAIGAGVGAGGGTAATALTGNRDVTISTEEKLNFKLTQPLQIPAN